MRAERLESGVPDVAAVDRNDSAADVEKARDQIHERGLAGAASADNRHHLSRRNPERDIAKDRARVHFVVRERHVPELNRRRKRWQRLRVARLGHLRVGVEKLEDAIGGCDRLLNVRVDPAELLRRRVHHQHRRQERREISSRQPARRNLLAAVPERRRHANAAQQFHGRRHDRQGTHDPHVGAVKICQCFAKAARLAVFGAKRLHDAVCRKRFGADMRHVLLRFLAPPRRSPDALTEPNQRIHDDGCASEADHCQPPIDPEEHGAISNQRERFSRQIASGLGYRPLHLPNIVRHAREKLPDSILRKETGRLSQNVAVEAIAQVHDDPLPYVFHQVSGEIRSDAFEKVENDNRQRNGSQPLTVRQKLVENRPDEVDHQRRRNGIDHHRQHRPGQAALIWLCEAKKPKERCHSVKRYFSKTHNATTPSRQVIFLPSS